MAEDQDISASIDSRIEQPIYGEPGFVDPRQPVPYVPLADTNVGGVSASEYEMRQAFARMDAGQRAAAEAAARAEETARALRIAAEDPALRAAYPGYSPVAAAAERAAYADMQGALSAGLQATNGFGSYVLSDGSRLEANVLNRAVGPEGIMAGDGSFFDASALREIRDRDDRLLWSRNTPSPGIANTPSAGIASRFGGIADDGIETSIIAARGGGAAPDPIDPEAEAALPSLRSRLSGGLSAFAARVAEDRMGVQWGIGFGGMALGTGAARAAALTESGAYVAPEIAQAEQYGGLLPGLGAIAGTFGGMLIPGVGSMGGQFLGQGVGEVAQSVWAASAGRAAAIRESGETYGGGMGAAADAVDRFTQALQEAHVPVKQLTETLGAMMNAGPGVGAGSVAGADQMAGALGGRFGAVTGGMLGTLAANPFLSGTLTRFNAAGSRLSPGEFGGLSELLALQGDWAGSGNAISEMQAAQTSPQYAHDKAVDDQINSPAGLRYALQHPIDSIAAQWRIHHGGERATGPADDVQRGRAEARREAAYNLSRSTAAGMLTAQSGMGLAAQSLSLGELSGQASVAGDADRLYAAAGSGLGTLGGMERGIDSYLADPTLSPEMRQAALYQRATVEDEMGKIRLAEAQTRRALFDRGLQTEESGYGLEETRSLYGGASAADLADRRERQAAFLSGTAQDPRNPLSPSERRQIEGQALAMRFQSAQDQYRQAEGAIGVEQAGAGADLSVARAYGGPSDVYQAQGEQARALLDLQRQLNDELQKGNLTYDQRIEKTRQVREITGEIASLESRARNEYFDSTASLLSTGRSADAAGLGRSLRVSGSAGTDFSAVLGDDDRLIGNAREALASARTPEEVARRRAQLAGAVETRAGDVTASQTFHLDAGTELADVRAQGAFSRAQSAPYVDGSDPRAAAAGLLGLRRRELSQLEAFDRTVSDPEAQLANAQREESLKDQIASLGRSQTVEAWRMLPEMIAGSPGRGVMAGVMPTNALSAFFSPGAMAGSWGPAHGAGVNPATAGGAAGGFDATHAGGLMAGGADIVALLRRIADGVERHGGSLGRSAPMPPVSGQIGYFNGLNTGR